MLQLLAAHDFIGCIERFSEDFCAIVQDADKIKEAFLFLKVIFLCHELDCVLQIQNYRGTAT